MKALSIKNPWADMIASGQKTIETRVWQTNHRGPLLICATKQPPGETSGMAVAVADLVDCRPMTKEDGVAACIGLYSGAFAWVLSNVRKIKPFPVRGQLKLFDVDRNI